MHQDDTKMDIVVWDVIPYNVIGSSKTLIYIYVPNYTVSHNLASLNIKMFLKGLECVQSGFL
jgi:hypothetical protein